MSVRSIEQPNIGETYDRWCLDICSGQGSSWERNTENGNMGGRYLDRSGSPKSAHSLFSSQLGRR